MSKNNKTSKFSLHILELIYNFEALLVSQITLKNSD